MAVLEIPTRSDIESYSFTIDLEQVTYGFAFHYNARMGVWLFDISSADGTILYSGIPIYVNQIPLARFVNPLLPHGNILFIDTSGAELNPGESDLGTRVLMIYVDSTEAF